MNKLSYEINSGLIGLIFGTGVVYATMSQKYGRLISMLILWADTPDKREQLSRATEPQ